MVSHLKRLISRAFDNNNNNNNNNDTQLLMCHMSKTTYITNLKKLNQSIQYLKVNFLSKSIILAVSLELGLQIFSQQFFKDCPT